MQYTTGKIDIINSTSAPCVSAIHWAPVLRTSEYDTAAYVHPVDESRAPLTFDATTQPSHAGLYTRIGYGLFHIFDP